MTNILMVEDNELNRDMLSRRLQRKAFNVVCALDGESGVEMAKSDLPDLILMDTSLPGIDGLDATRQLKADDATSSIPIIILTAHAMAGDRDRALESGADAYASKPVKFAELLEQISSLLNN